MEGFKVDDPQLVLPNPRKHDATTKHGEALLIHCAEKGWKR